MEFLQTQHFIAVFKRISL